jgi:predicted DNA-binding transcriptional regulator AlpA
MTDMLLTFDELCAFLKADEATVMSLIESGGVPLPLEIGNRLIRWVESDLTRWVQTGCPQYPPPTAAELAVIRKKLHEEKHHPPAGGDAGPAGPGSRHSERSEESR